MPREKINHAAEFTPRAEGDDGAPIHGEAWPEPEAEISWCREGDHGVGFVQIGLACPRAYIESLFRDLEKNPDLTAISVFSPVLNRKNVNHGIATLRRARDQAYGRDE